MSVTTAVPSRLNASEGKRIGPEEIGPLGEILADGGVLLVQREMRGHNREDAAGLQGVGGLGDEVVVELNRWPWCSSFYVGEGDVADHRVKQGQAWCRGNSRCGCRGLGAAPGRSGRRWNPAPTPMNRMAAGAWAMKLSDAAARLQHRGIGGYAEAVEGLVHRLHDGGGRVERVEGGALRRLSYSSGVSRVFSSSPRVLPGCVLVAAGDRIGEDRGGQRRRSRRSGRAPASPPAWRAAGPARCSSGCGWRRGCRGLLPSRRWRWRAARKMVRAMVGPTGRWA